MPHKTGNVDLTRCENIVGTYKHRTENGVVSIYIEDAKRHGLCLVYAKLPKVSQIPFDMLRACGIDHSCLSVRDSIFYMNVDDEEYYFPLNCDDEISSVVQATVDMLNAYRSDLQEQVPA